MSPNWIGITYPRGLRTSHHSMVQHGTRGRKVSLMEETDINLGRTACRHSTRFIWHTPKHHRRNADLHPEDASEIVTTRRWLTHAVRLTLWRPYSSFFGKGKRKNTQRRKKIIRAFYPAFFSIARDSAPSSVGKFLQLHPIDFSSLMREPVRR